MLNTMDKEILPCPFCESADCSVANGMLETHFIACNNCKAEGPSFDSAYDAIAQWNSLDRSLAMVAEFHRAFGHPVKDKPDLSDERQNNLRAELIREELNEFYDATDDASLESANVSAFDALLDLQVVLDGAFLALGFHRYKAAGLAEVHRSNMSKLGADGKPIYRDDGKILKGPNYTPPDLRKVLGL